MQENYLPKLYREKLIVLNSIKSLQERGQIENLLATLDLKLSADRGLGNHL
jgi:hypothetical protein